MWGGQARAIIASEAEKSASERDRQIGVLQVSTERSQLRKLGGQGAVGILAGNRSRGAARVGKRMSQGPEQLEFSFDAPPAAIVAAALNVLPERAPARRPGLCVIEGGGARVQEKLGSRDAVVRVLLEAGADLLLRRITPERAEHIERSVGLILDLFDRVDAVPSLMPVLKRQLDELESLMRDTRAHRGRPVAAGRDR